MRMSLIKLSSNNTLGVQLLAIMLVVSACKNGKHIEYYKDCEKVRIVRYYKMGQIQQYEHYSLEGKLGYMYNYSEPYTIKNPFGKPVIFALFDKEEYIIGDSVNVQIEVVNPPEIEVKCFVLSNNDSLELVRNTFERYTYRCQFLDSMDQIVLKVPLYKDNKRWYTYTIRYHINRL